MKSRRKKYLTNPKFQFTIIGLFAAVHVMSLGMILIGLRNSFSEFLKWGASANLPSDHVFYRFIERQEDTLLTFFYSTSVVSILFIIFGGILLSHKIAGPIYRLKCFFRDFSKGEVHQKFTLRQGDFFRELEDDVNNCLDLKSLDKNDDEVNKAS